MWGASLGRSGQMGWACSSLRPEQRPLLWELVRGGDGGAGTALFF